MPTYTTACQSCNHGGMIRMTFSDYEDVLNKRADMACAHCENGILHFVFNPGDVGFVMKDGPISGGWASKALKENSYRSKHREVMAQKERDHVFKSRLVPNFEGEETGTWREAQHAASTKAEFNPKTYEPFIRKERAKT